MHLKRTFVILLAVSMLVPSIVPSVAAQDPAPPDEPDGPDQPDQPDTPDQPEQPEQPDEPEQPDPDDPPEEPPEEPPEGPHAPSGPDAENTSSPRATYFEEDFENLTGFAQAQLDGDRQSRSLWSIEPVGHNGSMAAVLANSQGLPRGLHQGLVSPTVDLTPVPSSAEDPTVTSATEAGIDRANRISQETFRSGVAAGGDATNTVDLPYLRNNPLFEIGPISIPKGPASLTLAHSFNFDDTLNEQGEAVSGFAIEVKSGDGDWVPVEASMMTRPAHDADAPGPRKQAQEIEVEQNPCAFERTAQTLVDDAVVAAPFIAAEEFDEDQLPIPAECNSGSVSTDATPEANEVFVTVGDATFQVSTGPTSNETRGEGTPVMPNAYVQPLEQRGFTGDSDTDDDGKADVVGHQFDLSPWAGEEVEIRFRAGTSPVTDVPGGFWALDHVEVRAGARTADLRVNLTAPSQDHMAPPERAAGEDFPVQAQVQNVGIAAQEGPFNVQFTVLRDGVVQTQQTVEADANQLGFLETATAQLDLKVTGSTPYDVRAEIVSDHPDQKPNNDADADVLPVGVDESTDISVYPEAPVVEPGELSTTTVTVTPESNVPIDANLTLTAYPYDPNTQLPIGDGAVELGTERIQLPRSADRHPVGVENAIQSAEFTRTLTEGAYLLVAELGEETARAPLGVGTPPPPLLSEDFSDVDPGPESFTLETRTGHWTVRPGSDVMPVAPVLDPGSVANGSAWVPLEKESTLVRPQGNENITSGYQASPNPGNVGGGDEICAIVCLKNPAGDQEIPRAGTPLVLESPRGTQRVHAMATEVALHDASEAKLAFLSSLIPPRDGSGISEARVYVATDRDVQSLASQLTDPQNCPQLEDAPDQADPVRDALEDQPVRTDQDVCEIANVIAVDETADRLVQSVFDLEENVRCGLPQALFPPSVAGVVTNTTCPNSQTRGPSGTCTGTGGVAQGPGRVCTIDEPSQLGALAPMLSGTLVERLTTAHAWKSNEIDLNRWAGENVTVGFVFIGESQEAMQGYNLDPYGHGGSVDVRESTSGMGVDPLSGKIGYGPPGHSQGAFLTSRIQVTTDEGIKLGVDDTERIANQIVNSAQSYRPGTAQQGWQTIGYDHVEGLGDPQTPLRTSAQLLTGSGTPVASGADDREGLQLGVREETREGVKLYPRRLHQFVEGNTNFAQEQSPEDFRAPTDDPAVTVVSSPRVDLSGTENPQVRFRQLFDLATDNGPQGIVEDLDNSGVAAAFDLPSNTTGEEECALGSTLPENGGNSGLQGDGASVTLEQMRCMLEEKRSREAGYNVQNAILNASVAEPDVAAGMFVQARTVQEDGSLSKPQLVKPVDGYRYPFGDAGAFEPTLDYTVRSPDAYPGYATDQNRGSILIRTSFTEQPSYTANPDTKFNGTPVWAGDSDVDGDGKADWVTSQLDLSEFGGEEVVLEFVLVARQNQEVPASWRGDDGTILTKRPWAIDDVEVVESEVTGEVAIDQLRWPTKQLPVVTPGEDLPVRTTVTTPTGLDQPVHAKTVLVDGNGCVRGTDHVKTQYENEAGRVEPMPAGAKLAMPDMVIPGENVDGATPWDVLVGVDVGQEPSVLAPSNVDQRPIEGQTSRIDHSGALNVSRGANITMEVEDPQCEPSPDIVTVVPSGVGPIVDKDTSSDEEVNFQVELARESIFRNENELTGDTRRSFEVDGKHAPMLLSVSQGDGSDAGGTSLLMVANHTAGPRTASVEAPERAPVGSPMEVTLDVPRDLDEAYLWSIDPSASRPSAELLWPADSREKENLRATEERTLPVTIDEPGPHLLVLTGTSPGAASVIGGTMVVTSDASSAGDPTDIDNRAQINTIAGEQQELTVQNVNITPSSALSTTPRTVEAVIQNTGTTTLTNLTVTFTAEGSPIDTKTRDQVRAGEKITFTLPDFKTGGQPSVVVRVEATTDEGAEASGAGSVRSLVDMGSLTPIDTGEGDGWQIDGAQALFQDPETEKAPKDTVGAVDLVRQAHQPEAGARMEGLAGVAVQLDHSLDMEERFDGGQVILSNETEMQPLTLGPATKEMGAFSPVPGQQALTGVRDVSDETVTLDASDAEQETLLDQTATEALGYPLLTDNEDGDPAESGYATCESRTFLDDRIEVDGTQSYCAHSQPVVPTPSTAASQGLFHLQPAEFLSSEDGWTVENEDKGMHHRFEPRQATSYVFLEGGRDLIASAQDRGKMEIVFDEARLLDPFSGTSERPLSVEVCARFMQVDDDGIHNPVRRCTGLNHEDAEKQLLERDWGQTILTIGNIPEAEPTTDAKYNLVRIELSLQQDRTDGDGVGTMGAQQADAGHAASVRIQQPVKGWFVGPVTARAGGTSQTWTPDEQALSSTDPNTGLSASQLASQLDEDDNLNSIGKLHDGKPTEQFSAVALTEVQVTDLSSGKTTTVSTADGVERDAYPTFSPVSACPWHQAGSCAWTDIVDAWESSAWDLFTPGILSSTDGLAAATAPYAMNLTCTLPAAVATSDVGKTRGCDTGQDLPGMGVQVIDTSTIDRGTSSTCKVDEIGPPVLWRTQCLHVRRATIDTETDGEPVVEDRDGTSLKFTNTHAEGDGDAKTPAEVPFRSRGHSLDYRLVVPVDLRFAADGAQAWASPNIEEIADQTGNLDLQVDMRAQARIQGQDNWVDVPQCESRAGEECYETWQPLQNDRQIDLSEFVGQQIELAIRIQHPHPMLLDEEHGETTGPEATFALHNLTVEAGYLRLIDIDMQLRGMTDPSIQGEGWNVRSVNLFGLPIQANVGLNELDSKALVADQLHVHADTAAERDVYMSAPANLTVYNQGVESQTLPLEASLEARNGSGEWRYSTTPGWTADNENGINAPGECEVEIQRTDPDAAFTDKVHLDPGESKRISVRVNFIPEDANGRMDPDDEDTSTQDVRGQCFPGQFDSKPDQSADSPHADGLDFRMRVNVTDTPEEDYVASDNTFTQPLRPNPFLGHGDDDLAHRAQLNVTSFDVEPTRPAPDQPVRVSANVSLVDGTARAADLELKLVDPASDKVLRSLSGTDADTPITTFRPYTETSLNWTLSQYPENETLIQFDAEIVRNGDRVTSSDHGWLAANSIEEDVVSFSADNFELDTAGDAGYQSRGDGRFVATTAPRDQDQNDNSFRFSIGGGGGGDETQGVIAIDEWVNLEDSPPPLVAIKARWSFSGATWNEANGQDDLDRDRVLDGWAVQVCHVADENPDSDDCPIASGRSTSDDWAWRTVEVVRAPEDTLAGAAPPDADGLQAPGNCNNNARPQNPLNPNDGGGSQPTCSAVAADWPNMHTDEDVLTNTSPGFSRSVGEEGAFRTVIAPIGQCSADLQAGDLDTGSKVLGCPQWNTTDRHNQTKIRLVALGSSDTSTATLTVSDITLAPVGVRGQPLRSTAGEPIPEEAPKAVPMEASSVGAIGTKVDTSVDEPEGWSAQIENLPPTNAIEGDTNPRLLVEAPISPSGVSQSAVLSPSFEVEAEPTRSIETLVPIGVRAGQHPDLVVEDVELSDGVKRDDEALVQVRIKNDGFETSEEVEVTGVARYDDGQVNLLQPPKGKDRVVLPSLPPGVEETVVLTWTPSESGNATVRVGADLTRPEPLSGPVVNAWDGGQVAELQECDDAECNNVGTQRIDVRPPREADTSVDVEVLADTPLVVGEPVDVRVTVHNDGPATVPAYEVRLLAGVVSLLEDDPLRVTEPLAPGESWSTTVQMIPGFGGNLDLVGQVNADESLVRERRGLQPGGGTYDEDNVDDRRIPVVARGLTIDVPRIVRGDSIAENGTLELPVTLRNLGSEALSVSAAATAQGGIGTLVDGEGEPIGTVDLAPGEAQNATLLLLYESLPDAGRQPVTIDAVSKAGVERTSVEVEVPGRSDATVRPVVERASAGKVMLPVTIDGEGNAPVQAQVAINAPGVSQASRTVEIDPHNETHVEIPAWLDGSTASTVEGEVVVRADSFTRHAPLRIVQEGDVMPTIENARAVGGTSPHTWVRVANLGSTAGSFDLALVQGNETLAQDTVRVTGGASTNVTLDALPDPGTARIELTASATDASLNWTMDVPDLRPDVRVLHSRLDPVSPETGETVEVQATIANEGGSAVDLRPGLFVDGVLHTVSAQEQTVEPGAVTSVTFEWTAEDGDHTLSVSADPQDRIHDAAASDDAMANEVAIQSAGASGALDVPLPGIGPLLLLLAGLAVLRRGRRG